MSGVNHFTLLSGKVDSLLKLLPKGPAFQPCSLDALETFRLGVG